MKRLLALTILSAGLIPSIVINNASAIVPNQQQLQRHCRDRLGFGQTEPLYGPLLLQLRRCIDSTASQYQHASRLIRRTRGVHYASIPTTEERVQPRRKVTQRTLNTRMERLERNRLAYYRTTSLGERDILLLDHRRSRRANVQEQQDILLRQNREKYLRWKRAVQACRVYGPELRQPCMNHELNR